MRKTILILFARQVLNIAFRNKAVMLLTGITLLLLVYAAISGYTTYQKATASRLQFQKQVRDNWEKMPDKHPHRMAHYGYIAFRAKHPLSFFDFGTESYTGNAVFLEAHRQNSVNFSEAGFSTGTLRFGEISMSMILQVVVPLIIFFLGFNTVAADRENGTLKIILSQGASWKEIILGKSIGLLCIALIFLIPALVIMIIGWSLTQTAQWAADDVFRMLYLALFYFLYLAIISITAVIISAVSKTAKVALTGLIGIWLLFAIILPRTTQAIGTYLHPSPSKIEFETAIEKDLIQRGDSHDPNDPHYKSLKDSILQAYKADSVQQLPFNYSGFQMKEGEKISAEIYSRNLSRLLALYQQQNNVSGMAAFVNPFAAIKNLSMAVCGTDFNSYVAFQQQAEDYRYRLAQHMNDLQIRLISNKKQSETDKPHSISSEYWKAFPDFSYKRISQSDMIRTEMLSIAAFVFWMLLLGVIIQMLSKKIKAV